MGTLERLLITTLAVALLATLAPSLALAKDMFPNVGDQAPDFSGDRGAFVVNKPDEVPNVSELYGDVVVIATIDITKVVSARAMVACRDLYAALKDRGLHMYFFECYGKPARDIEPVALANRLNFPIATGARSFEPYFMGSELTWSWLIGPDGIVDYRGNPGGSEFENRLLMALHEVEYPGLGLLEISRKLKKAGKAWVDRDFQKARKEAQKAIDKLPDDPAEDDEDETEIREQAQQIIDRATHRLERLVARAAAAFEQGDYRLAVELNERIEAEFDDTDEAEAADEMLDTLEDDEYQEVIRALNMIDLIAENTDPQNPSSRAAGIAQLRQIAERNPGTAAARKAEAYIDLLDPN